MNAMQKYLRDRNWKIVSKKIIFETNACDEHVFPDRDFFHRPTNYHPQRWSYDESHEFHLSLYLC